MYGAADDVPVTKAAFSWLLYVLVWLRRGASPAIAALGILGLIGSAIALTRVDSVFAGRAYAACGGIYIVSSLVCCGSSKVSSRPGPTCSAPASRPLVRS